MKFKVTIEEVVSDTFDIEAESDEDAIARAIKMYNTCDIVLTPGNLEHKQLAIVQSDTKDFDWIEF